VLKVILLPLAIFAFVIFLIVLGAIGLGVAFVLIAAVGRVWRFVMRRDREPSERPVGPE
jgi:hypothetical protein